LRNTLYITLCGVIIYFAISTIVADPKIVGAVGGYAASINQELFGYVSFGYLFVLLYPLYRLYKNCSFDINFTERSLAALLLFCTALILQALLVEGEFRGALGSSFVDFLHPYVGGFGLWVLWLVMLSVSAVLLIDAQKFPLNLMMRKKMREESSLQDELQTPSYKRMRSIRDREKLKVDAPKQSEVVSLREIDLAYESTVGLTQTSDAELEQQDYVVESVDLSKSSEEKDSKSSAIVVEELDENRKLLDQIDKGRREKPKNFKLPSADFLQKAPKLKTQVDEKELDKKIGDLIDKLAQFKINGDVVRTYAGPVVSTFEFKPAANIKVSKILNLQDDLAMALKAETIRIQAPIPGKDVVGIEIPNYSYETIYLREIFEDKLFIESASPLTIALGKDIVGKPFITDLKKLPHLLIAGTTGSGKSVGINAMILSLLYKNSPDQLRLLMIDPKMLEFSIYNDIPHLLTPVITKAKQAITALANMVVEMERRYQLMSESRTKNIENYNEKMSKEGKQQFPYIVIIIDELADLMMTSGKDVEHSIARLAQMARASGIHLIVATQRPSVDVVTGLIKANLPSRISYRVGQRIDSKIILDTQGAESLLGRGDMLFTPPGSTGLIRLHAPWSSEDEIEKIVEFIKSQRAPQYDKSFLAESSSGSSTDESISLEEMDELYEEARQVIISDKKTSISYLQRKLQIGYNRSARIIEQLQQRGVLSEPNSKGIREIL